MTTLPDYILNVLPGGKYHDMAVKYAKHGRVLQWKDGPSSSFENWSGGLVPFTNGREWRIKPETQRYRVASMFDGDGYFVSAASSNESEALIESSHCFLSWLTDWIEYEV